VEGGVFGRGGDSEPISAQHASGAFQLVAAEFVV
jgi:hypothetical protein